MTKRSIAKRARISVRMMDYRLKGKRDLSRRSSERLERVTGIPAKLWMFGPLDKLNKKFKELL